MGGVVDPQGHVVFIPHYTHMTSTGNGRLQALFEDGPGILAAAFRHATLPMLLLAA